MTRFVWEYYDPEKENVCANRGSRPQLLAQTREETFVDQLP